jgi:hypothetical protein
MERCVLLAAALRRLGDLAEVYLRYPQELEPHLRLLLDGLRVYPGPPPPGYWTAVEALRSTLPKDWEAAT